MRIRTLDIDELNDRLSELEGMRDLLDSAREDLEEATDENREELETAVEQAEEDFGQPEEDELKQLERTEG